LSQSIDALNLASHETIGIDIHVTPEKIVLLDTQVFNENQYF